MSTSSSSPRCWPFASAVSDMSASTRRLSQVRRKTLRTPPSSRGSARSGKRIIASTATGQSAWFILGLRRGTGGPTSTRSSHVLLSTSRRRSTSISESTSRRWGATIPANLKDQIGPAVNELCSAANATYRRASLVQRRVNGQRQGRHSGGLQSAGVSLRVAAALASATSALEEIAEVLRESDTEAAAAPGFWFQPTDLRSRVRCGYGASG